MKEIDKLEKRLNVITAVLLTVLGAVLGLNMSEFLSSYFDKISDIQRIISCVVTSAILALVMLSLTKPISLLLKKALEGTQSYLATRPAYKNMNVVFGIILGISLAILTGSLLNVFAAGLKGSIHFIIVTLIFLIVAYASSCLFNKIIGGNTASSKYYRGYVITASAFTSDKLLRIVPKLIGKIAVMDVTVNLFTSDLADAQINECDVSVPKKAFDNYMALKEAIDVKLACVDVRKSEMENIVELAKSQKLKIITLDKLELFDDNEVDVLYLSEI